MKKLLLATTVLVGTAGFASAEVTLSGDARMGVVSGFDDADTAYDESNLTFSSRARVSFGLSGATDNGIEFGGSFRADNAKEASGGTGGSVFIAGSGVTLSMGDLDSAAQALVGQVSDVGYTGNQSLNEITYLSNITDPSAMVQYSNGGITVAASVDNADALNADVSSIAASYATDAYKFSVGFEGAESDSLLGEELGVSADLEQFILGADATFGSVTVKARYASADASAVVDSVKVNGDAEQYALSATYTQDALSATAFYSSAVAKVEGEKLIDANAAGIGAAYSLGGGATVSGGISTLNDDLADTDETVYELGVNFSF